MSKYLFSLAIFGWVVFFACNAPLRPLIQTSPENEVVYRVMNAPQIVEGDPAAGFRYISQGDYIGSGVPYDFMKPKSERVDTVLDRDGRNAFLPYTFMAFEHANGTPIVSGNCFTCHASPFMDSIYFGLGNSFSDFQQKVPAKTLYFMVARKYGKDSPEWEAFHEFGTYYKAIAPHIVTEQVGPNTAFRLAEACAAIRDPLTLELQEEAVFAVSPRNIATDVPPLWHLKKKAAIYYNGMGRGDLSKLLMQSSVLGIHDSTSARAVQQKFHDVVAWIQSLEPPVYPGPINESLAQQGSLLFENHCKKCHGTYGERPYFPNKIVPLSEIGTDPLYADYSLHQSKLSEWYNQSWFAVSPPYSSIVPSAGYMAPPLDGVWATAPYLHNGSVPTLEDLLYSPNRPIVWERSGSSHDYDWEKVGWQYQRPDNARGKYAFDTRLPGYSPQGHTFGDTLSADQRKALIEYLKTL